MFWRIDPLQHEAAVTLARQFSWPSSITLNYLEVNVHSVKEVLDARVA